MIEQKNEELEDLRDRGVMQYVPAMADDLLGRMLYSTASLASYSV